MYYGNEMDSHEEWHGAASVTAEVVAPGEAAAREKVPSAKAARDKTTMLHLCCGIVSLLLIPLWFRPCVGVSFSIFGFGTSASMSMQEICVSGGVTFVTSAMIAVYLLTAGLMLFPVWRKAAEKHSKTALVPLFVAAITLGCNGFAYFTLKAEMEEELGSLITNALDISLTGSGTLAVLLSIAMAVSSVLLLAAPYLASKAPTEEEKQDS